MITIKGKLRIQTPNIDDGWLYIIEGNGDRNFVKEIALGKSAVEFPECTNEQKLAWEEAHKQEKPISEEVKES